MEVRWWHTAWQNSPNIDSGESVMSVPISWLFHSHQHPHSKLELGSAYLPLSMCGVCLSARTLYSCPSPALLASILILILISGFNCTVHVTCEAFAILFGGIVFHPHSDLQYTNLILNSLIVTYTNPMLCCTTVYVIILHTCMLHHMLEGINSPGDGDISVVISFEDKSLTSFRILELASVSSAVLCG